MNQIKRKRRLTALEAAVLGNILYLMIVIIFKSVFDIIGRTGGFNYLYNGIELGVVGLFWIIVFGRSFKNIYPGDKPHYFKYMFFSLIPIVVLTIGLTLVSLLWPGQDTNSTWNQFAFLAAPTIFWYLPYGLIYQLIGSYISIYVFFGIALGVTILFQILGILVGRRVGRKYREETIVEAEVEKDSVSKSENETKRWDGKGKKPQKVSIGMERLAEKIVTKSVKQGDRESVLIGDSIREDEAVISKIFDEEMLKKGVTDTQAIAFKEKISQVDKSESVELTSTQKITFENQQKTEDPENSAIKDEQNENEEVTTLEKTLSVEWKLTHPVPPEKIDEVQRRPEESGDKSFLKETSQIRIINEDDIEEYYRNKK
ncbi:MAG: hypothetical protein ACOH15_02065 [Acetobacterium sp.]